MKSVFNGIKILIVEDEGVLAMSMRMALNSHGYSVTGIASTGRKAIELAQDNLPDVIFMDIKLRGDMDGVETAAIILKKFNKRVIYITAHTDEATTERASNTNPLCILEKPVDDYQYFDAIENALHQK